MYLVIREGKRAARVLIWKHRGTWFRIPGKWHWRSLWGCPLLPVLPEMTLQVTHQHLTTSSLQCSGLTAVCNTLGQLTENHFPQRAIHLRLGWMSFRTPKAQCWWTKTNVQTPRDSPFYLLCVCFCRLESLLPSRHFALLFPNRVKFYYTCHGLFISECL